MKNLISVLLVFITSACDSPLRHIKPENRPQSGADDVEIVDVNSSSNSNSGYENQEEEGSGVSADNAEDSIGESSESFFSSLHVRWTRGPFGNPNVKSGIEIVLFDSDLNPVSLEPTDLLYIQGDMGMGHGLANRGEFYSEDLITWKNDTTAFYMGGDYIMTLSIYDKNFNLIGEATWRAFF